MTTGPYVLPQATLVIILGASTFPRCRLESSPAFGASAEGIRDYFVSDDGFHLPPINLLDLFDSPKGPSEIMDDIADFLIARQDALKTAPGPRAGDLLVYYAGHGGFTLRRGLLLSTAQHARKNYARWNKSQDVRSSNNNQRKRSAPAQVSDTRLLLFGCFVCRVSVSALVSGSPANNDCASPGRNNTSLFLKRSKCINCTQWGSIYNVFRRLDLEVLCQGVPHFGPWISMEQVGAAVRDLI